MVAASRLSRTSLGCTLARATLALVLIGTGIPNALAQESSLERTVSIRIPGGPLPAALIEFSKQTGIQVITSGAAVKDLATRGVQGDMPASSGLRRLLEGTPLGFHALGPNTVGIDSSRGKQTSSNYSSGIQETGTAAAVRPAVRRV